MPTSLLKYLLHQLWDILMLWQLPRFAIPTFSWPSLPPFNAFLFDVSVIVAAITYLLEPFISFYSRFRDTGTRLYVLEEVRLRSGKDVSDDDEAAQQPRKDPQQLTEYEPVMVAEETPTGRYR